MWEKRQGTRIDGVASVDPVALSHVLHGTGPVRVPGGRLTSGNAGCCCGPGGPPSRRSSHRRGWPAA
jgi:hypothetical protein